MTGQWSYDTDDSDLKTGQWSQERKVVRGEDCDRSTGQWLQASTVNTGQYSKNRTLAMKRTVVSEEESSQRTG